MKNKLASALLPAPTTDSDETRIDIVQLETESQSHDRRRDDSEKGKPVVPSANATREETGALRSLLPGRTWGGPSCLMLGQRV
jgi:hypothetical protein